MPELVALGMEPGPLFVHAIRSVWDAGDVAAPLDPRLPPRALRALIDRLAPTRLLDADAHSVRFDRTRAGGGASRAGGASELTDGDALVMMTSGSTAQARAVVLTHGALGASATATTRRLAVEPAVHHWLACLPLSHIGGMAVVTRALLTDTALTVLPRFDTDRVSAVARSGGATHVALVATALARIDAGLFVRILLGGSAPPRRLPPNVVTTYGMTETGSGIVYDGVPLDGVDLAIGTGEDENGAKGEILVRGPMLMRCYRDGSTRLVGGPDGAGGWFPTGDGGRIGIDGRLHVDGRLADVIVTGAEKVWPSAVERVLAALPSVGQVAVWRRADPEWGQRVVAWVVPADPALPPSLRLLREAVQASALAPWAAPKELELVRSLPKTPSGKVRRSDLR